MTKPIHLEGTTLEGGGQLLRIAIGLSSLTKIPIHITNIRGKRSGGGGLKAQHLTSVQWLGKASNAKLSGAGLKSKEITFAPHKKNREYPTNAHISQSTPGSINLVLQAILPYILFSWTEEPVRICITGGTNVSNSPSYDYASEVLLPMLSKIGMAVESQLHSRGWSTGSARLGSATYNITPLQASLPAFRFDERGDIHSIKAIALAPKACESHLRKELQVMFSKRREALFDTNHNPEIEVEFEDSHHDKRFYLLLVATTTTGMKLGRDWLYDHGFRAGKIDYIISSLVKKVMNDLISEIEHGGCVDGYLRDQLVIYQALAKGKSVVDGGCKKGELVRPSLHTQTAHWVVNEVLGVQFEEDGSCEGIAFVPSKGRLTSGREKELVKGIKKLDIDVDEG
ncbi:EPT/RTPC-like protein [Lojkania enalia]|uniref:EPT/RTPC-like protein n=1 Tax=Lojkania enalia TaxID=147567 RepID=A0A9P4KCN9_9PLEO|nr:EPT/RTPC-like protein [Didymosphaeria enalia]